MLVPQATLLIGPGGPRVMLPSALVTNSSPPSQGMMVQDEAMSLIPTAEIWEMLRGLSRFC